MASFLELVEHLIDDPAAKGAYLADPHGYLDAHGFGGLDHDDVAAALHHVADAFPPRLAAHVSPADGLDHLAQLQLHDVGLHGFDDYHEPWEHPLGGGEAHAAAVEHPWTNDHEPWDGTHHDVHAALHDGNHDVAHDALHDVAHDAAHGPGLHQLGAPGVAGGHAGPGTAFDLGHDVDLDGHRDVAAHHDDLAHHAEAPHVADHGPWYGWDDPAHHAAVADVDHPDATHTGAAAHGDLAHGDLTHGDLAHEAFAHEGSTPDGLSHGDLTHIDVGHAELAMEHHWTDDVLDHGHHGDDVEHLTDHGPTDHHDDGDLHHH